MTLILHVSDIHCATRNLQRVIDGYSYDIVVASGDFECVDTAEALLRAPSPVVAVTGNMDDASVARILRDAGVLLDGRRMTVRGLVFAGAGGLDPAGSLSMLERKLSSDNSVDVLVTHHPPKGILDKTIFFGLHAGLREVRELVFRVRPRAHLFGHIHEAAGHEVVEGILFVNAGPLRRGRCALVDLDRLQAAACKSPG